MRVFIHKDSHNEFPSINFCAAFLGFKELGWEIAFYQSIEEIDCTREDVIVDYVDQSRTIMQRLGRPIEELGYPDELTAFLGRRVWATTIDTIANNPDSWNVFVKPKGMKIFTGRHVRGLTDLRGTRLRDQDTPIWASEPISFVAEWRCFVRYGKILDLRRYKGDWRVAPDTTLIEKAIEAYRAAPAGCALDFGLTTEGRTLLVEVNDGHSLGSYGLFPIDYAKLLAARWSEVMGVIDPCKGLDGSFMD